MHYSISTVTHSLRMSNANEVPIRRDDIQTAQKPLQEIGKN